MGVPNLLFSTMYSVYYRGYYWVWDDVDGWIKTWCEWHNCLPRSCAHLHACKAHHYGRVRANKFRCCTCAYQNRTNAEDGIGWYNSREHIFSKKCSKRICSHENINRRESQSSSTWTVEEVEWMSGRACIEADVRTKTRQLHLCLRISKYLGWDSDSCLMQFSLTVETRCPLCL